MSELGRHALADAAQIETWIKAARGGCQDSLQKLFAACRDYLLPIARHELPPDLKPKVAPSDIVQDSLIEAYRDFPEFHGVKREELLAWVRRILLNNLANTARSFRDTHKRSLSLEVKLGAVDSSTGRSVEMPHDHTPASKLIERIEQGELVAAALTKLRPDHRHVILLRYEQSMPFDQIAQQMGRSEAAVRRLWSRAVDHLRSELRIDDAR